MVETSVGCKCTKTESTHGRTIVSNTEVVKTSVYSTDKIKTVSNTMTSSNTPTVEIVTNTQTIELENTTPIRPTTQFADASSNNQVHTTDTTTHPTSVPSTQSAKTSSMNHEYTTSVINNTTEAKKEGGRSDIESILMGVFIPIGILGIIFTTIFVVKVYIKKKREMHEIGESFFDESFASFPLQPIDYDVGESML